MSAFVPEAGASQPFIGTLHVVSPPPSTWSRLSAGARRLLGSAQSRAVSAWGQTVRFIVTTAGKVGGVSREIGQAVHAGGVVNTVQGYGSLLWQRVREAASMKAGFGFLVTSPKGQRIIRGTVVFVTKVGRKVIDTGASLLSRTLRNLGAPKAADQVLIRKGAFYARMTHLAQHPRVTKALRWIDAKHSPLVQLANWALGIYLFGKFLTLIGVPRPFVTVAQTALGYFWDPFTKETEDRLLGRLHDIEDKVEAAEYGWQQRLLRRHEAWHASRGEKVVKVSEAVVLTPEEDAKLDEEYARAQAAREARRRGAEKVVHEGEPAIGVPHVTPGEMPRRSGRRPDPKGRDRERAERRTRRQDGPTADEVFEFRH